MKCEYVKKDGKQCGSYAIQDSKFCYFHSPEMVSKRKKASAEGGSKSTQGLEPAEPIQLEQQGSVVALLQDTINRVRRVRKDGSLDVKTANCIGFLAGKMVEANKVTEKQKEEENQDSKGDDSFQELFDEDPIRTATQIVEGYAQMIERKERYLFIENDPLEKLLKAKEIKELKVSQAETQEMLEALKIKTKMREVATKIDFVPAND